ncbi:hypothetical protein FRC07_007760 [Ceratobasidium sp. 392]|nr:hypothetical protein FRC07_007760 [Ceratobasidium sp. 392]
MGKQGKSSASSATRKKHAKKAVCSIPSLLEGFGIYVSPQMALDPSISIAPAAKSQTKGKGKKSKEPRVKQYIPPPKFKSLVEDPIDKLATTGLLPPNMVLIFRGLSKKDPVTKTKALEELSEMLEDESWPAALPVWLWHFVPSSVHPSRRIRELNAAVHSKLVSKPELRSELQAFLLSRSEAGTLLAAWLLGANDTVGPIAALLRSSWDLTILWRQGTEEIELLDIQDQLDDLVSSVIQAIAEPDTLYQQFAPLAAATKDGTDKAEALNAHEQSQDRDARIRTSGLGALGWIFEPPATVALPQVLPALIDLLSSNTLIGSALSPQVFPPFLTSQAAGNEREAISSFGYGQRGVRIAAWGLIKVIVKYLQQQNTPSSEFSLKPVFLSSLGTVALRSAWVEPDVGARTSMWEALLGLLTAYPEVWSIPPPTLQGREEDEASDSEDEGDDTAAADAQAETQAVLPGQAAYTDFLSFLQMGCLGSAVQSYPAIVIVLSTIPFTILPYDNDYLERFFTSFWAAYDSNALSVLPRDRELVLKSFLSAYLECIVFVCRKLKQNFDLNTEESGVTDTLLESTMKARIGQVITEVVQGGLIDTLSSGTTGVLLGASIKKLEQIAPDVIDHVWKFAWKPTLLDTQDQVSRLQNSVKLLASILGPLEGSAISEQHAHNSLVEIAHVGLTEAGDVDSTSKQGQVLSILWEHAKFSNTAWLTEITRNALRDGLLQHLISSGNSQDTRILLNGFLSSSSVLADLGLSTWIEFLRLTIHNSAFELLREVLDSVQFSFPHPIEQPELFQTCISWAAEINTGNKKHLRELLSVLEHWEICMTKPQLYNIVASIASSFLQEAEELVFAADYSQIATGLESTTKIMLTTLQYLDAQSLKESETFDLAQFGAFLYILPALGPYLPAEFTSLLPQFEPSRNQWRSITTPEVHASAKGKGQTLVARLLSSCATPLSVSDVLNVASRSGLYVDEKDLLANALPPHRIFDELLDDLAHNPSSLLAEVDPLVPPIGQEPISSALLDFDAQGLLKYPRLASALAIVLSQNRHIAKEELWAFRHLLALQQLCTDFVSVPSWPSDAFRPDSLDTVRTILEHVSQLIIYIGNSLLDDLDVDWHRKLAARLSKLTDDSVSPRDASDVVYQLYSLASQPSAPLRDIRLLRRVAQTVLRDADSSILDVWAGFAPGVQTEHPLPAVAIGSVVAARGVESPRLDRWRNELASRLAGVPPSSANAVGIPLLRTLNSLAPPTESGIVFLPQQRAVYLIQALQKWMTSDEDLDESLESHVTITLYHLLPIIQTVPGAHWEFTFDILENNLGVDGETSANLYLLLQTLRAVYSVNELASTNKALQEEWKIRREGVYESILALFLLATENDQQSETQDKYHTCLVESLRALSSGKTNAELLDKLLSLISSKNIPIKAMAHELARNAVAQITEQRVVEAAMTTATETDDDEPPAIDKQYELPHSLIERLVSISPQDLSTETRLNLLLSWWIAIEFFDNASLKVKQGYLEQLRRLDIVRVSLLPCLFELLSIGVVGAKPFGLSQWYVDEYWVDLYDASLPTALNVIAAHIYYKALKSIPGLIRSWWSDCQDKQLALALSTYTKTHFSPVLIGQELAQFRSSAASASEALNDDAFSVKVAANVNEISAAYTVDDQAIEVAIRLPSEFPLKAAEVRDVRSISGMENRRRAWVFGVQQTAQQGLIYDALSVFKKNVAGHFEGKSECAICYS